MFFFKNYVKLTLDKTFFEKNEKNNELLLDPSFFQLPQYTSDILVPQKSVSMLRPINVIAPTHHFVPNSQLQNQQVNSPLVESISNIQKLGLSIPLAPNNGEISDVFDILSLIDDIQ
jgi:hypothetical protein